MHAQLNSNIGRLSGRLFAGLEVGRGKSGVASLLHFEVKLQRPSQAIFL
jgi:hypothetical protein